MRPLFAVYSLNKIQKNYTLKHAYSVIVFQTVSQGDCGTGPLLTRIPLNSRQGEWSRTGEQGVMMAGKRGKRHHNLCIMRKEPSGAFWPFVKLCYSITIR